MSNFTLIIRKLVLISCFIAFFGGCGEKQTETPVQPKVISQKITIKKDSVPKPAKKAAIDKPVAMPSSGKISAPPVPKPAAAAPQTPQVATSVAVKPEAGVGKKESSSTLIAYIPEGKIDPFAPLFTDQPIEKKVEEKVKKRKKTGRIPSTPLEKMDLSQLKLVAIVRTERGNKALVQDATGKGYVLNKGTYIGLNSGFVTKITADRVIIEEKVEDIYGKKTLREKELVLLKPRGEI